ncbi:TolC family protein [Reichenbachiella sp. MALMAid0571]|uniref:TolC family protein n=1 Tax=Reichenbachiella sp. MALMAid0571 TaxID=3143939 RepID=UPI0032DEFA45
MRQIQLLTILILLLGHFATWSQSGNSSVLTLEQFYQQIHLHHPIAKQAVLLKTRGNLIVSQARGSFDPKIVSDYNQKQFDGKTYFDLWDTYVQIPTLLNVDLKAGYERNKGTYLNAENTVPTDGLYYAGISVPFGQGLLKSERNINLEKSKFEKQSFENQAQNVLNNLFFDANFAYWLWYENHQKRETVATNLELIEQRFEGIKQSIANGDKASIDSVEMLIQVQQWSNKLKETELNSQNSMLLLQNFIWTDGLDFNTLSPYYEDSAFTINLDSHLDWALKNHPDLKKLTIESNLLEMDRKWASEQLKPIIDVNYNLLLSGQETEYAPIYSNNYKLGVQFVFPLLIRKERAKLKIVKVKQQEYDLKINQKNREVINKIQQSYNKVYILQEMIQKQEQIQVNYERMLQAEQTKFENGESSVFLLNSRENKKLLGQIKLIELQSKFSQSVGELKWATGKLYDDTFPE